MASTSTNRVLKSPLHSPVNLHMEIILNIHLITILQPYCKKNHSFKKNRPRKKKHTKKTPTEPRKIQLSPVCQRCKYLLRSAVAVSQQWAVTSLNQERSNEPGFSEAIRRISQDTHWLMHADKEGRKGENKFFQIFILINRRNLHEKLGLEGNLGHL